MAGENMLEKMLAAKKEMAPQEGFNVVGIDTFALPGEEPYLVGHFGSVEEANAAKTAFEAQYPGEPVYVYGPQGFEEMVQKSDHEKFHDFTAPIVRADTETYERVKRVLIARHGYKTADFEKDGELYGMSTNELLDLILEDLRSK